MNLPQDEPVVCWPRLSVSARLWFCAILVVTALLSLLWSHWKLFWVDELLEYYTDSKPGIATVLSGQFHAPFSLEPPAFHLLLHEMHRIIPSVELASRLPSMAALLLTQVCVFWISLRWKADEQQAVAAMLLPLVLVTVDYGPEARVYEVLTACLAIALLCWQRAVRSRRRRAAALLGLGGAVGGAMLLHYYGVLVAVPLLAGEAARTLQRRKVDAGVVTALLGLGGAVGGAMLLHYYGVLVAVPLLAGEAARTLQRRKVDAGVVTALLGGASMLLLDLPFQRALAPFRLHYYATGETSWLKVPVTYDWFVLHWWIYAKGVAVLPLCMIGVFLLLLLALAGFAAGLTRSCKRAPVWIEAALLATALLPIAGLALAQLSHAYVPRYSLPAVVGFAVLLPAVVFERVRASRARELVCAALLATGVWYGVHESLRVRRQGAQTLAEVADLPTLGFATSVQHGQPIDGETIYVQNLARFLVDHYYAPAQTKARLVAFYSRACELHWSGRDPSSLFAKNIAATTTVPAIPFHTLANDPAAHLVLLFHDPDEEWIWRELKQEKAEVRRLGPALGGELVEVRFMAGKTCDAEAPREGPGTLAEQDAER